MTIDGKFDIKKGSFHLNVEFSVPEKGVTGIFGPSGCGKTSFLRAIAGLDRSKGGTERIIKIFTSMLCKLLRKLL